ncbi:hypothetical protein R0K19_22715, partial [Bacillus sp. SIMBA_161]
SKYYYDEIRPLYRKVDPARLIRIDSPKTRQSVRGALVEAIWGEAGLPDARQPARVETLARMPERFADWPVKLSRIQRLSVPIDYGYAATAWV